MGVLILKIVIPVSIVKLAETGILSSRLVVVSVDQPLHRPWVQLFLLVVAAWLPACSSSGTGVTSVQPPTPTDPQTQAERSVIVVPGVDDGRSSTTLNHSDELPTSTPSDIEPETATSTSDTRPKVSVGSAVVGADGFARFSGERIGLVTNHAALVSEQRLINLLLASPNVELVSLFAPEHGIRADAGPGEELPDEVDPVTGMPVYSLFGETRKPTPQMLDGLDTLVFDLQDVGARFYTYISTMGLAMQAAAEADVRFVVLDRPNPLGARLDGPLLSPDQASFVGKYPIPAVHGMTVGELAEAIVGEGWIEGVGSLDLEVVEVDGWAPDQRWSETGLRWIAPSPGLPTATSTITYPSTVLFEATTLSYGQGTESPFGQIGAPWLDAEAVASALNDADLPGVRFEPTTFSPGPRIGVPDPRYGGRTVPGVRIEVTDPLIVQPMAVGAHMLHTVLQAAANVDPRPTVIDRPEFFDRLAGDRSMREQLEAGVDPSVIVQGWQADLEAFERIRSAYTRY